MLGLKKKDSNKEIELIATIADFNQDYVKALKLICASKDVQNPKAIASRILKELIDFNIYAYKS